MNFDQKDIHELDRRLHNVIKRQRVEYVEYVLEKLTCEIAAIFDEEEALHYEQYYRNLVFKNDLKY